uniref:Uncharacterized protein LOC105111109 isoform X2 n=1 Tax=Rhizophora mucronata TaxID=61149 RepID=A0A2P2LIX0_RHIMU
MAVKLQHDSFIFSSMSNPCLSRHSIASSVSYKRVVHLERLMNNWGNTRKRCLMRLAFLGNGNHGVTYHMVGFKKLNLASCKPDRVICSRTLASSDDGVTVNGSPSVSANDDVEETRIKLSQSLRVKDYGDRFVQSLHDATRIFELAIKDHGLPSKLPWFSTSWLGIDKNAWVKTLSYQVCFHS